MSRIVWLYLFGFLLFTETVKCQTPPTSPPTATPTPTPPSTPPETSTSPPIATSTPTPPSTSPATPTSPPTAASTPTPPSTLPATPTSPPIATSTLTPPSTSPTTPTIPPTATSTPTPPPTSPTTPTIPPTTTVPRISQRSLTWTADDVADGTLPNPFVFEVPEDYFISVTVSDVNISNFNFLRIESGDTHQVDATQGRIFTNTVKGPYSYLFKTNHVHAYCETGRADGSKPKWAQFTVKFEQVGELTTTTTTPATSTVILPTTDEGDSVYITVNVNGRSLSDYRSDAVQEAFKTCVIGIANKYCNNKQVHLQQEITTDHIIISQISQCPYNWPDSNTCVQITFRLAIFHDGSTWTGYQLDSAHLELMWADKDTLDTESCFSGNKFGDYEEPDVGGSIVWWAVGISLVIVAFVALLWFLRTFSSKVKASVRRRQRRRNSDAMSIVSRRTESVSSLTPHYLQDHVDTPKFFET